MKIAILGGGLAGCTLGYLLKGKGHDVVIVEKDDTLGGMCKTYYKDGLKYEYGPHILYSRNEKAIQFIKSIIDTKPTEVLIGSYVEGQVLDYPVSLDNIFKLQERRRIVQELYELNRHDPDTTNFETFVQSLMGETLYRLFIHGYTKKFWGMDPSELSSSWAPHRISFRTDDKRLFEDMWQAYPDPDFNEFFVRLGKDIPFVQQQVENYTIGTYDEDLCISTISLDQLLGYEFGALPFRGYSLEVEVVDQEHFLDKGLSWVNYPNDYDYTRVCEYKHYNYQQSDKTIISREFPGDAPQHYPINTKQNEALFEKYLSRTCEQRNLISMGRLGLYCYIPMDVCILMCMALVESIPQYLEYGVEQRLALHNEIRGMYHKR